MYIFFSSRVPHSLYCLVTVLYGELNETYGPLTLGVPVLNYMQEKQTDRTYEPCKWCLRFVTAFTVRTDLVRTVDKNYGP